MSMLILSLILEVEALGKIHEEYLCFWMMLIGPSVVNNTNLLPVSSRFPWSIQILVAGTF
jgi:pyruvoyl-dependent arginine decarboxylase (PvlArgDC)